MREKIAVAQSEKEAIIANLTIPTYKWIAICGDEKTFFETLKGHDVTLFPKLGKFDEWDKIAFMYEFKISRLMEMRATDEERKKGLDVSDVVLKEINNARAGNIFIFDNQFDE
jgi:hypothetical protein